MDSQLTLREGLAKFREENSAYLSHEMHGLSEQARVFFESHDVAHVLFGCDISLMGEGAVKIWTLFGTTLGWWQHVKGYRAAGAFSLSQKIGMMDYAANLARLLLAVPVLIMRARRMHKLWPWAGFEAYLDQPIKAIRKEFNIRVLG